MENRVCALCKNPYAEEHHVFFGSGYRALSTKYHMTVYLCSNHHRGQIGVHHNRELDLYLKQLYQQKFIQMYPDLDFTELFGRNYLWD